MSGNWWWEHQLFHHVYESQPGNDVQMIQMVQVALLGAAASEGLGRSRH